MYEHCSSGNGDYGNKSVGSDKPLSCWLHAGGHKENILPIEWWPGTILFPVVYTLEENR